MIKEFNIENEKFYIFIDLIFHKLFWIKNTKGVILPTPYLYKLVLKKDTIKSNI